MTASCPSCGSEVRDERGYVPGSTGMPVTCNNDWHDEVPAFEPTGTEADLAYLLGDTYICTRVWGAWQTGTMTEEDFTPAGTPDVRADFIAWRDAAVAAALEAAQPSPAMAERAARLLLTEKGVLPEVHVAWREPLEPFCGNPDGFGPGGHTTYTLRVTCLGCNEKGGLSEDELAKYERWGREGLPAGYVTYKPVRTPTGWEFEEHVH